MIEILLLHRWAIATLRDGCSDAATRTRAALERWIDLGLGFQRGDRGERYFDPVEVVNFMTLMGRHGRDRFWADHFVHPGQALVKEAAEMGLTKSFNLTLRRRFNLQRFEPGAQVRLRLPVPCTSAHVTDTVISPAIDPSLSAKVHIDGGRMEVQLKTPAAKVVEIGVDVSFTATRDCINAEKLTPEEEDIYLRPSEGLVRVTSRVQDLAAALTGVMHKPGDIVRAFWAYMMDQLWCGAMHYDQLTAETACDWVLDHKWYDCQLGSALFVSLCRARGIPARMVSGNFLYRRAPMNYFWAEAWIDGCGWTGFDFVSWGLSFGGRDAAWRDHFFGKIDFRLVTQILPLTFTGPMSVRLPPAWHMVQTSMPGGGTTEFLTLDGELIYADSIILK